MKFLPASVLLIAASLLAQQTPPVGRPGIEIPPLTEVKTYLELSDTQVTQLADLRKQLRDAIHPLATQAAEKRRSLGELRRAGNADSATAAQLKLDLAGLRKQISDKATQYGDNARALLNSDQQAKLQALEEAAKLLPAIHQAEALNLIEGAGPFGRMMGEPRGPMGAGAGMMQHRPPR